MKKELDSVRIVSRSVLNTIIDAHRGTILSTYLLTEGIRTKDLASMESIFASLNEQEQSSQPGRLYAAQIKALKTLNVGSIAPNFKLKDVNQEEYAWYSIETENSGFLGFMVWSLSIGKSKYGQAL